MNTVIDDLITKIDAVMCGQLDGAVQLPEFEQQTLDQLRAVVRPVIADCRVCQHLSVGADDVHCSDPCVMGDKFERVAFVPLWRTEP